MTSMQLAIAARANYVASRPAWWGFAEWIAFGWKHKTQVHLLYGKTRYIDVFSVFAPSSVNAEVATWPTSIHVLACSGENVAEDLADANHFMFALPMATRGKAPSCGHGLPYLLEIMASRGYAVITTTMDGNCGPDTCSVHLDLERTPRTWATIRESIKTTMLDLAKQPWFLDTFSACQEDAVSMRSSVVSAEDLVSEPTRTASCYHSYDDDSA